MNSAGNIEVFATAPDGSQIRRVTISNGGAHASLISWGATLQDFRLDGVDHSFVLGSPSFEPYLGTMNYFGAIVGRAANRISNAKTVLKGKILDLHFNENGQTILHGGRDGASAQNWAISEHGPDNCRFSLRLPDGQAGFPGNLDVYAIYRLASDGTLRLEIEAQTDQTTFCNFAHHSFWNLDGADDLSNHLLTINADNYLPVDERLIPLGPAKTVGGTPFDFRNSKPVAADGNAVIDHNFCINDGSDSLRQHCVLETDQFTLSVRSTEPGLQVYDAGRLSTKPDCGHGGKVYAKHAGLALEPQRWPDAPHQPNYPTIVLKPGEIYRQISEFQLAARVRPS